MKLLSCLFILMSIQTAFADPLPPLKGPPPLEIVSKQYWKKFKLTYKKTYNKEEEEKKYKAFKANLAKISKLNENNAIINGQTPYGVTEFSDIPPDDFAKSHLGFKAGKPHGKRPDVLKLPPFKALPATFDWREKGALSPMKAQGQCGSCWAFSAIEQLETAIFMDTGQLPPLLSAQQVNSCDPNSGGCNGGTTEAAFSYIEQSGVESERKYPYTSGTSMQTGSCLYNPRDVIAKITGYHYGISPCDSNVDPSCDSQAELETNLQQQVLSKGPASICVNAAPWQYYKGGVIAGSDCAHDMGSLDHCVQLAGWDTDSSGNPYWILRNQWGSNWGEEGFLYLEMGVNTCGLANLVTYVDGAQGPSLPVQPTPRPGPVQPTPGPVQPTPAPLPIQPTPSPTDPIVGLPICHACVFIVP